MIFEGETGRGAGGGKAELVDDFLPEFIMRNGLATAFFTDGFVEFEEIKFLSTDLWYFDLSDAFGVPVFGKVFLKFTFLF